MAQTKAKAVRLFVVEEQELHREACRFVFSQTDRVDLVSVFRNGDISAARREVLTQGPDVLMVGTKQLDEAIIEELEQIRADNPGIGIVLFLVSYDSEHIELLRDLALKGEGGVALFLKQSLDHIEQLTGIVIAASRGQVILDPALAGFLFTENPEYPFLKQLTARELEILSLLSKGYTNSAIAETLYIDVRTVENHINSMYGKLKAETNFGDKHARVSAARLYLEATGELLSPNLRRKRKVMVPSYS
ncbi:MAG: response regulator transcription factor [Chloroflexota bacterium]|nr:response regulator transcription factor [Chloroflexota bacterium]